MTRSVSGGAAHTLKADLLMLAECDTDPTINRVAGEALARVAALEQVVEAADDLLRRLAEWDVMSVTGDGPYWLDEIRRVRALAGL